MAQIPKFIVQCLSRDGRVIRTAPHYGIHATGAEVLQTLRAMQGNWPRAQRDTETIVIHKNRQHPFWDRQDALNAEANLAQPHE